MNRYRVTARREGDWWVIDVDGVGATQAKRLDKVEHMARDLVSAMLEVNYDDVQVDVRYELPLAAVEALADARSAGEVAKQLARISADATRYTATVLHNEGLSLRDTAHLLGVSFQRVHQILGEPLLEPQNEGITRAQAWERALKAVREAGRVTTQRTTVNRAQRGQVNAPALAQQLEPAADRVAG